MNSILKSLNSECARFVLFVQLLLLIGLAQSPALASGSESFASTFAGTPKPKPRLQHTHEFDPKHLDKLPELPYLPLYTGKGVKMLSATSLPNLQTGQCFQGLFLVKEDPQTVLEWYRAALSAPQLGWTLEQGQPANQALAARRSKDGLIVFIGMRGGSQPEGYKCKYMLRYMQVNQPKN